MQDLNEQRKMGWKERQVEVVNEEKAVRCTWIQVRSMASWVVIRCIVCGSVEVQLFLWFQQIVFCFGTKSGLFLGSSQVAYLILYEARLMESTSVEKLDLIYTIAMEKRVFFLLLLVHHFQRTQYLNWTGIEDWIREERMVFDAVSDKSSNLG